PYGERLGATPSGSKEPPGDPESLRVIGSRLSSAFSGWTAAVLAPEKASLAELGRPVTSRHQLYNGRIPIVLAVLDARG
ncbi:MAG: hypothetical protein OEV43_06435, partial [Coriobacteriia bacterium]|nr:hypothetical protein [Coriobacteriia bacterium]